VGSITLGGTWRVGTIAIMRWLMVVLFVILADEARTEACSHPYGNGELEVVSPRFGDRLPVDGHLVIQVTDCCVGPAGELELTYPEMLRLRLADDVVDIPVSITEVVTWNGDDGYLRTDAVTLVPDAALMPDTDYEMWAVGRDDGDTVIRRFTTASDALGGDAPAAPEISVVVGAVEDCYDSTAILCCGPMSARPFELEVSQPGLLYTLTTPDGIVLAANLPAPMRGVLACGDFDLEPFEDAIPPWAVHQEGTLALDVIARDAIGRTSPPTRVSFELSCSDGIGCAGCASGRDGEHPVWAALLAAFVLAFLTSRRTTATARARSTGSWSRSAARRRPRSASRRW
jgi:MYXO-CTERM domain-containing protein